MAAIYFTIHSNGIQINGLIPASYNLISFWTVGGVTATILLVPLIVKSLQNHSSKKTGTALENLRSLLPAEFEAVIQSYFDALGYRTWITPGSQDHGVDIIVYDGEGEKWVVQCKRYRGAVGEPIVRDLLGAMVHERASCAYLMTTGEVSQRAWEWISDKPIKIYEGQELIDLLSGKISLCSPDSNEKAASE